MKTRKVKYIIFMIDDRHMDKHYDIEQQLCWTFLTDSICSPYWDSINKKKKKKAHDYQIAIGVWIGIDDPSMSLGKKQFGS